MEAFDSRESTFNITRKQFGIFVGELFGRYRRRWCARAIHDQSAGMRLDGAANFAPLRGVNPYATAFHGKLRWQMDP